MNVTMPAPTPNTAPAAAPNHRIHGERPNLKSTTSTGRRTDDERSFEEQLDEMAVALGPTTPPTRDDAPTRSHTRGATTAAPAPVAEPVTAARRGGSESGTPAGSESGTPAQTLPTSAQTLPTSPDTTAMPTVIEIAQPATASSTAPSTQPISTTEAPVAATSTTDAPVAATDVATATDSRPTYTTDAPVAATDNATATDSRPTSTTDAPVAATDVATATDSRPTSTTDAPTPEITDPAATHGLPTATPEPVATTDADAPPPLATLAPVATAPIDSSPTSGGGADRGAGQRPADASLGSALEAAATVVVDVADVADVTDFADGDGAMPDAATPTVVAIPATAVRRDEGATSVGGAAPLAAEAADDLAPPMRLAPPRTIAVDLNDEGLGPLRVIATTDQRTVHLTVSAGETIVRDALVRQQGDLRDDLAEAGLQLGSFDVDSRATERDHTDQTAVTSDRPTARSTNARAAIAPIRTISQADGRLDLRL